MTHPTPPAGTPPRALYLHVPFCARRCFYCDFAVDATREPPVDAWIDAVTGEIESRFRVQGWETPLRLDTLYIGGGTPSLLGTGALSQLKQRWFPWIDFGSIIEWTCEANPESFSAEMAAEWASIGVNRLSFGVQSFDPAVLSWMGRLHGPDRPAESLAIARAAGIDNVSIDLIFGLPDHLERNWEADLERTLALKPKHVSLYGLTAEAGAPLGRRVSEGAERLADEDRYAEEFLTAHRMLTAGGLEHYEVSNFGEPGRHSLHNQTYWTGAPYLGIGSGAHSYLAGRREWNLRSWTDYQRAIADASPTVEASEGLDQEDVRLERIWLDLRTLRGISLEEAPATDRTVIDHWLERGLASERDGRAVLTPEGWLLLDELAVRLASNQRSRGGAGPRIDVGPSLVQISPTFNS